MLDAEALFDRVAAEAWTDALDLVRAVTEDADSAVTRSARQTLVAEMGRRLEGPALGDGEVELLLLLGRSGRLPVGRDLEARIVESLLHRYRDVPERALAVARFRPDVPAAIAVIGQYGAPAAHAEEPSGGTHRVTTVMPGEDRADAGRPLFRSDQERLFFEAACRVYAGRLVQMNVALHAALDFEALRGRLLPDERTYFFRALVDGVVFDPEAGYRPIRFFELDSPVHGDARARERDAWKDRIVALAGHRLVRVRAIGTASDADGWERMLRDFEKTASAYIPPPASRPPS